MILRRHHSRRRVASALLAGAALAALASATTARAEDARLSQGDDPYYKQAHEAMRRIMTQQRNTNRAKNVILIVGDGMGFSTVTAARIFEGQQRGVDGESNVLAWEAFPYLAASKPTPPTRRSPTRRRAPWP
jgi:alkaline phosphatase